MVTEAQKRANARYMKASVTQKVVRFYPRDAEALAWAESREEPFGEYVRRLISEDMAREGRKSDPSQPVPTRYNPANPVV